MALMDQSSCFNSIFFTAGQFRDNLLAIRRNCSHDILLQQCSGDFQDMFFPYTALLLQAALMT